MILPILAGVLFLIFLIQRILLRNLNTSPRANARFSSIVSIGNKTIENTEHTHFVHYNTEIPPPPSDCVTVAELWLVCAMCVARLKTPFVLPDSVDDQL